MSNVAPPTDHSKKRTAPKSSLMLSVIDGFKLIENPGGRLAFERSDYVAQNDGGRVAQKKMEVVGFAIDFSDFAIAFTSQFPQGVAQKVSPLSGECMLTKLGTENDVSRAVVDAMACNVEVEISDKLTHGRDPLLERADGAVKGLIQPVEEIDAVRFRVYPSRVQQQVLKRWIGAQRYIYNQKVEELEYQLWLKNNAKFSDRFQEPIENHCAWDQTFSKYSESASWLEEIPSFIRRNGCSRFKSAMAKWGKGCRRPQLKTRKSVRSVLLTSECFTLRTCDGEDCFYRDQE